MVREAILDGKPLGAVEIVPKRGFFDFRNKYTSGRTDYHLPARLSPDLGKNPPRRPAVADGLDHRRGVLRGDARNEEVPQRHVGPLELVLGRQDVGRDRGGAVGDDLRRGQDLE